MGKFMKRKTNTAKRKNKANDKKAKIEAMQWIQSEAAESNLIIDDRRDEFMMYRTGRRSFGNFNVAVEKMEEESIETIKQAQMDPQPITATDAKSKAESSKKAKSPKSEKSQRSSKKR